MLKSPLRMIGHVLTVDIIGFLHLPSRLRNCCSYFFILVKFYFSIVFGYGNVC